MGGRKRWSFRLPPTGKRYGVDRTTGFNCSPKRTAAISGIISPITEEWDVALGVMRGYCSESFAWTVGQSLATDRHNVVAQLGDHDPSGVGAWNDFARKVTAFKPKMATVTFTRLAVTPEQISEWDLPLRPTKTKDTRAHGWVGGSVEMDAIPAPKIRELVNDWIRDHQDTDELRRLVLIEEAERATLQTFLHRNRQGPAMTTTNFTDDWIKGWLAGNGGTPMPAHDDNGDTSSSWRPVDLTAALAGGDVEPPALLHRTDNVALLYQGRTHQFAGESESNKTWTAILAATQVLNNGGTVLWVDFEDDENGIVSRLRALAVSGTAIAKGLTYVRPDEPLMAHDGRATAGGIDFGHVLTTRRFNLAVIDGVTESMGNEGLDLNSNADVATWSRRLPKRIATTTGAAVISIDHVVKNAENRGRYALGGGHKLAGLTGAAYRFDMTKPLARATFEPVEGAVTITVTKDRPGYVRAHAIDYRVGTLDITAYPDGGVMARITPPGETSPDLALVKRVAEYLHQYDGAAKSAIEKDVAGRRKGLGRRCTGWPNRIVDGCE